MKTVTPDYYDRFVCIADRCRHTCCEGWEIDVDEESLERYQHIPGEAGERLRSNIVMDDCPHFKLTETERCPFLNDRNLCELILGLGEDVLCQICTDHPRFRSCFSDRTEIGLGLCCEAAGALILGQPEPMRLVVQEDDGTEEPVDAFESVISNVRSRAFELAQDRSRSLMERMQDLLDEFEVRIPQKTMAEWAELLLSLERLDRDWDQKLAELQRWIPADNPRLMGWLERPMEQLLVYFLYRHLPSAQDETELKAYIAFAVLSCRVVLCLALIQGKHRNIELSDLVELARLYSSEIEYSEENTDAIVQLLWDENDPFFD